MTAPWSSWCRHRHLSGLSNTCGGEVYIIIKRHSDCNSENIKSCHKTLQCFHTLSILTGSENINIGRGHDSIAIYSTASKEEDSLHDAYFDNVGVVLQPGKRVGYGFEGRETAPTGLSSYHVLTARLHIQLHLRNGLILYQLLSVF